MPMVQATLETALVTALAPTSNEATAVAGLAAAYASYTSTATAGAVPINPVAVVTATPLMAAALVGMSAENAAATKLLAGVLAFWGRIAVGLSTSFTGAIAITPPPHAAFLTEVQDAFDSNTADKKSLVDAASAVAAAFHTGATTGGTATFPGPSVSNIT